MTAWSIHMQKMYKYNASVQKVQSRDTAIPTPI